MKGHAVLCIMDYIAQQTVREPTALPRRNSLSKIGPLIKNENLCSVLYPGILLPLLYLFFYEFLVMGTNPINTASPSTPRRSKMPLQGQRRDTPSSSIARAATAGYRCRWHRISGIYWRQSGETARREQRLKRKRE